jgi:hypothetical protein
MGGGALFCQESKTWRKIEDHKDLYLARMRTVYAALTSAATTIDIYATQETHEQGNSMYTKSWWYPTVSFSMPHLITLGIGQSARYIGLRTTYWSLPTTGVGYTKSYWTIHEFARYFLFLDDDVDYSDPALGVQSWDDTIEWLADKYQPPAD